MSAAAEKLIIEEKPGHADVCAALRREPAQGLEPLAVSDLIDFGDGRVAE